MFNAKSRQDKFRLILPNDFIVDEINNKYAKILKNQHSYIYKPIDYINESIQKIQILGFNEATTVQQQHGIGGSVYGNDNRIMQNAFLHTGSDFVYRSENNPLQLIDKTFNVTFKHNVGFLNYFILFENFWYTYSRDTEYIDIPREFTIDILNYDGSVYARIVLEHVLLHGMDMLDLDYSQPIANSQTFNVVFKYSNIRFEFITDELNHELIIE
jgi:hypothetical protein